MILDTYGMFVLGTHTARSTHTLGPPTRRE